MNVSKKIVLQFDAATVDQPIIYTLATQYNLVTNILKAEINPEKQGELVLELRGDEVDLARGVQYMEDLGITLLPLEDHITHSQELCTQCGLCVSVCPTSAFSLTPPTMELAFDSDACILCHACLRNCPYGAISNF